MFLKNYVLVFAIVAVEAMNPNEKDIKIDCNFPQFQKKIYHYLVLLQDNKNKFKGTGYIVTANTLITPSGNLKDYHESIHFRPKMMEGSIKRWISFNTTYNTFLSVARFRPKLSSKQIIILPTIPTLPMNKKTSLKTPVFTVGFAKNHERRLISSLLKNCEDNICKADLTLMVPNSDKNSKNVKHVDSTIDDDPNFSDLTSDKYFPQIGDVLVTQDRILGFMLKFKRKNAAVSAEYYFKDYPVGDEFKTLDQILVFVNPDQKVEMENLDIFEFGMDVLRYIVLLRDSKDNLKGAGYVTTFDTIITPSQNLQNYEGSIEFYMETTLYNEPRKILANTTYGEFLSVARFAPPLTPDLIKELPRLPILPINKNTPIDIPVVTLGFTGDRKRRMAVSDLTDWDKNMWKAGSTLVNSNPDVNSDVEEDASSSTVTDVEDYPKVIVRVRETLEIPLMNYSPLLGDVLITNGYILGILVKLEKKAVFSSGEYYSFTYPSEKDIEKLEKIPPRCT